MTPSPETLFVTVHLVASTDLDTINKRVANYEHMLGALVLMNIDNDTTLLKFSTEPPKPSPFARIARQVGGKPEVPAGATLVTTGQIFIGGDPVLCVATRGP